MSMFFVDRNISYGQYANCLAALHIGGTVFGINSPRSWRRHYGVRLELFTDCRRLRFRRFSFDKRATRA
jgi:hypothetical protein